MSTWSHSPQDWCKQVEEYFKGRGFQDIPVTCSRRRRADKYAENRETKTFALVERKSRKNCEEDEGLGYTYPECDYYLCDRRRPDMWTIVEPHVPAVLRSKLIAVRNFAVAISHQLYCYFWDVVEGQCRLAKVRDRKWTCTWPPTFQLTEPYLVVPLQYFDALDWVMREFHTQGWLPNREPVAQDSQLDVAVARIFYPLHKPSDLSKAR